MQYANENCKALGNKSRVCGVYSPEPHREVYCVSLNFNLSKLVYSFARFFYIQQTFLYCNATMRIYKTPLKSPYLSSAVMRPDDSSGHPFCLQLLVMILSSSVLAGRGSSGG